MGRYIPQYEPTLGLEEESQLVETIKTNWISEGPKTKKFEEVMERFIDVAYAVTVPNGTLAITVACFALEIGKGDEVIIPDLTMAGTANGVILAGALPVFSDVKDGNLTIDPKEVEKKITKKTKAVIPVHLNGRASDMKSLLQITKRKNLKIIEDAAQAFGSKLGSKYLGTIGDIGCFSFSVPKIVTTGQGGMLVTNEKYLYKKILKLKDQGRRRRGVDIHDTIGFNFRFTDLQAAVGLSQMRKLSGNLKKKKKTFSLYRQFLDGIPQIRFVETNLKETVPWFMDVLVEKRDKLASFLEKNNVEVRKFYPPMHSHEAYRDFIEKDAKFPNATKASKMGIWLPSSLSLTREKILYVCSLIRKFYQQ